MKHKVTSRQTENLWWTCLTEKESDKFSRPKLRLAAFSDLIFGLAFFLSAFPFFWSIQINGFALRYWIWIIPIVLVWVDRLYRLKLKKRLT